MSQLNDEWFQFIQKQKTDATFRMKPKAIPPPAPNTTENSENTSQIVPEGTPLNISTKTMILKLNVPVDTIDIFWKIPVMEYWHPKEGVIHKYMQMISNTPEELETNLEKLRQNPYPYKQYITKQVNNKNKKVPEFKDSRKIVIGINRKNILNGNKKEKKSFMNSFAIIFRFEFGGIFREVHAKIFNTGKMVIPGILSTEMFVSIKKHILEILQPYFSEPLTYLKPVKDSVIVNSDFNCGFHILRDELYDILKHKYKLDVSFNICAYPGVKCRFYFNGQNKEGETLLDSPTTVIYQTGRLDLEDHSLKLKEIKKSKKYTCVTFTIFRTGSCIVTGNCNDQILHHVCNFLKTILKNEYWNIKSNDGNMPDVVKKTGKRKSTYKKMSMVD